MFDLMPFNRREDNLFHYLDNLEKNFWGDLVPPTYPPSAPTCWIKAISSY